MILLAFFFPLALYLLVLGVINRRDRPLLVSGIWDGIGLVFAASGFLLFAGPAVFTSLRERWRVYWLFGQGNAPTAASEGAWQFWIFLSVLYFLLIVGGAVYYFWRQRSLTSIYNVEAAQVEQALAQICEGLGLNPVQSGGLFLFGSPGALAVMRRAADRVQASPFVPSAARVAVPDAREPLPQVAFTMPPPGSTLLDQSAILELDSFPLMHHVTLRWDPASSSLRPVIESELAQRLADMPARESTLGGWLLTLGCLLLSFELLGAFAVLLLRLFLR